MNKRIIIIVLVTITVLLGCDNLIISSKGRVNINDELNPSPAADNVEIEFVDMGDGVWNIRVYWDEPEVDYEILTEGWVVVRNTDSVPQNIYDGTFVGRVDISENKQIYDDFNIDGYPKGRRVYYSVFSYVGKWDLDESDKIYTDVNGNLVNSQYYNFTGPAHAYANVWDDYECPIIEDGMRDATAWNTTSDFFRIAGDGLNVTTISCLKFNIENVPEGNYDYVTLVLTKKNNTTENVIEAGLLNIPWSGEELAILTAESAVDSQFRFGFTAPGFMDDTVNINLTEIFNAWYGNVRENNGIILVDRDTAASSFEFYANESVDEAYRPRLIVNYWNY